MTVCPCCGTHDCETLSEISTALTCMNRGQIQEGLILLERALGNDWSGLLTRFALPDQFEFGR